jgi:hypothetical protein
MGVFDDGLKIKINSEVNSPALDYRQSAILHRSAGWKPHCFIKKIIAADVKYMLCK